MKKTKKSDKTEAPVIKRSHKKKVPGFSGTVHALEPMFPKRSHKKKPNLEKLLNTPSVIETQIIMQAELDRKDAIIDLQGRIIGKKNELMALFGT